MAPFFVAKKRQSRNNTYSPLLHISVSLSPIFPATCNSSGECSIKAKDLYPGFTRDREALLNAKLFLTQNSPHYVRPAGDASTFVSATVQSTLFSK